MWLSRRQLRFHLSLSSPQRQSLVLGTLNQTGNQDLTVTLINDTLSYPNLNEFIFLSYQIFGDTLNLRHTALVLFLFYLAGNELASGHLFLASQFNETPTLRCRVLLQNNLPFLVQGETIPDG